MNMIRVHDANGHPRTRAFLLALAMLFVAVLVTMAWVHSSPRHAVGGFPADAVVAAQPSPVDAVHEPSESHSDNSSSAESEDHSYLRSRHSDTPLPLANMLAARSTATAPIELRHVPTRAPNERLVAPPDWSVAVVKISVSRT